MKPLFIFIMISSIGSQALSADLKRSKSINFEDELVEGINRKPLDSFNQISELNESKNRHLYLKRSTFADRNRSLLKDMKNGETP